MREGVLRQHIILWDGFIRDTVFYSIIDKEWPQVKEGVGTEVNREEIATKRHKSQKGERETIRNTAQPRRFIRPPYSCILSSMSCAFLAK